MSDEAIPRAVEALNGLAHAHLKRLNFLFEGLCVQIDSGERHEVAASHFRKGLENLEAAYLLAQGILADVFDKPVK